MARNETIFLLVICFGAGIALGYFLFRPQQPQPININPIQIGPPAPIEIKIVPDAYVQYHYSVRTDSFTIQIPVPGDPALPDDPGQDEDTLGTGFMGLLPENYLLRNNDRFSIRYWDFRNLVWVDDIYRYPTNNLGYAISAGAQFNLDRVEVFTTAGLRYRRHHVYGGAGAAVGLTRDLPFIKTSVGIKLGYKYDLARR